MKKWLKTIGWLLLLTVALLAARTLIKGGVFKTITPHADREMQVVKGMTGAEDITVDPETGMALVSGYDRRAVKAGKEKKGAIYLLDFQANPPKFRDLTAGFDKAGFRPHGISLFKDPADGSKWVFAVSHPDAGHVVEIFRFTDSTLIHSETISSDLFLSPNDVVGVGKRQFYFTNDHDARGGTAHLKDFLLIGTGQVGFFNGNKVEILAEGIRYANGINVSRDGKYLFVAACTDGSVGVWQRSPFSKLLDIQCGTGVDNIELDAESNLWVGAHPKMLAFLGHAKDPLKRSPSQILKIEWKGPATPALVTEVYLNDGNPLSGSSAAAVFQNYLLMGTVFEDGVLVGKN